MSTAIFREPFNGLSHLAATIMAIAGLCLLVAQAALHGDMWHIVSFSIFGACMILMFACSTLYHLILAGEKGLLILKRFDHMAIFMMIAGTYTPMCLVPLRGSIGWTLLGIIWGLALLGIVLKAVWIGAPRWSSTLIYLAMGWSCVFTFSPMVNNLPEQSLAWLVCGGVFYTLGALIYGIKWPNPKPPHFGFHEIWHLFVIGGAFSHFMTVFYLL
ncbi:MAG: hemolysin III family protein [Myxococcota bacterium]|nr:hemolysin III family protein [Myxococcota bacterium]